MVYLNRCSFRTSDGMQRKKLLHPPEIHSFHSNDDFLFPTLWFAFSAADSLWQCSTLLPSCVRRIRSARLFSPFASSCTICWQGFAAPLLLLLIQGFWRTWPPALCIPRRILHFSFFLFYSLVAYVWSLLYRIKKHITFHTDRRKSNVLFSFLCFWNDSCVHQVLYFLPIWHHLQCPFSCCNQRCSRICKIQQFQKLLFRELVRFMLHHIFQ